MTHRTVPALLALALCLSLPALAAGQYRNCNLVSGRVTTCSSLFSGTAAQADGQGVVRMCKFNSGRLIGCGVRFTGQTVVFKDYGYRSCDINAGHLTLTCHGLYQGSFPMLR